MCEYECECISVFLCVCVYQCVSVCLCVCVQEVGRGIINLNDSLILEVTPSSRPDTLG